LSSWLSCRKFFLTIVTKNKTLVLKTKITDQDIVNGILQNDSETIKLIYKNNFDRIESMVKGFRNISLDAEDVFQEGLTRAIINVRNKKFKGDSSFPTYLYGICRNLCLKDYHKNKAIVNKEIFDIKEEIEEDHFERLQLIIKLKDQLDEPCKRIIDLRFGIQQNDGVSTRFESIAKVLNINADNARQRFRRCFGKLKNLVSDYKELIDLINQTNERGHRQPID
jgi:RNA polymerase sigma factor (sigma-70 family)